MKSTALFRFAAVFAAAAGLFTALPAAAVFGDPTRCEFSTGTTANAGYAGQCVTFSPATLGSNPPLDLFRVENFFNTGGASFEFSGTSNQANAGPFQANPGSGPVGTLALDQAVKGFFALVLQSAFPDDGPGRPAAASYGIYLFNGSAYGNGNVPPVLAFDTFGIGDRNYNSAANTPLAFAGLFRQIGPSAVVPEPAGVALALTALGALALTKRRRG